MKIIKFNIIRSEIDAELSKITAYTGAKSPPDSSSADLDRIATVDEDAAMLSRYWQGAANTLADRLKEFISGFVIDDTSIEMSLEVSGSFDDSLTASVENDLKAFIAANMARAWFAITVPNRVADWDTECSRLLLDASRKLYHRRRPVRK